MLKIFVGIITAVLAVIGFYALIGSFARRLFEDDDVVLSILALRCEDADRLEALIIQNLNTAIMLKPQKLFLLLSEETANDPEVLRLARKYGAELYIVRKID